MSEYQRKKLRAAQLEAIPYCEATLTGLGCLWYATDVHEIISRGVRPEAHLEPELFVSLCRICHGWITDHPAWGRSHGYVLMSSESELIERARELRGDLPCQMMPSERHKCPVNHLD